MASAAVSAPGSGPGASISDSSFNDKVSGLSSAVSTFIDEQGKPTEVRLSNMNAAKGQPQLVPHVQANSSRVRCRSNEFGTKRNGQDGDSYTISSFIQSLTIDPNGNRRGRHHQRWSYYPEAHGCAASCCSNGLSVR